jgi:hypothetical protein
MSASNQDVLRLYLLGAADAGSQDDIEHRLFSDDQVFWERLSIAEDDLIDDYAAHALDEDARRQFESHFLCTAERRAKLQFALALRGYAREERAERTGAVSWLRAPSALPRWAVAVAASLLVLVPGVIWQFAPGGRTPAVVTVSIAPGMLRDAGAEIARVVPTQGCQVMHLDLTAGSEPYSGYAATIFDVSGEALWSQHRLSGVTREGAVAVRLTLPCDQLPEGDYWVRLSGLSPGQEPTPLDRYDVRVLRQ